MSHRIDADVNSVQPPGVHPMLDCAPSQPERDELSMRHHPMLTSCQLRHHPINWQVSSPT